MVKMKWFVPGEGREKKAKFYVLGSCGEGAVTP